MAKEMERFTFVLFSLEGTKSISWNGGITRKEEKEKEKERKGKWPKPKMKCNNRNANNDPLFTLTERESGHQKCEM